jgi:hypothetical protein
MVGNEDDSNEENDEIKRKLESGKLVQKDLGLEGAVPYRVYKKYFFRAGASLPFLFLGFYLGNQVLVLGSNYWLAQWSILGFPELCE